MSISSAADSPVRTSAARASELASLVLEAAYGTSSLASLRAAVHRGSSSKTSEAEQSSGFPRYAEHWNDTATRRYRSRLRRAIAERPTNAHAFSSSRALPPTATTKSWHRQTMAGGERVSLRELLPTLGASSHGSNRGGQVGRVGEIRPSLRGLLPTLTTQRATYATRRDQVYPTLHGTVDGPLNPRWLEWFMGFPDGWLTSEL